MMPKAARSGDGNEQQPPLVCVHGLSGSSRWWTRVTALIDRHVPLVLSDVPRSLKPSEVETWLAGRIEELGPPVDLAGHSLGALVSVRVAALRPELVRRLVLISPPGVGPPRSPLTYAWPLARTMLGSRPSFLVRLTYDGLRAGPRNLARGGLHVARADVTAELASGDRSDAACLGRTRRGCPHRGGIYLARTDAGCAAGRHPGRGSRPDGRFTLRARRGDPALPRGTIRRGARPLADARNGLRARPLLRA